MATSAVEICNSALVKIGAKRITALSENSPEARLCQEQYEKVRDDLLCSHPWNFAIKRVTLTATTNTPAFGYAYEFNVPSDCLRVLNLGEYPEEVIIQWRREGDKILCDDSSVHLQYIAKETDVSKYPAYFVEVLAFRLAYDICYSITQSTTLKEMMRQDFLLAIRDARTFDAQESSVRQVYAKDFFNVRF